MAIMLYFTQKQKQQHFHPSPPRPHLNCSSQTNNVKMQYQSSSKKTFSSNEWQEKTNIKTGSWFFEWYDWLKKQSGKQKNAKPVNQYRRKIIEPAPGSYVKKTY